MFALRGLAISSSVFFLVYTGLSVAILSCWRWLFAYSQGQPVRRAADLLFFLRILPLSAAAVVTAVFTVPSFLLLEPRSIEEPIAAAPLILGLSGLLLGTFGVMNSIIAMLKASHQIVEWVSDAQLIEDITVPVLRISRAIPALTAAGIIKSRVLVSGAAEFVLTEKELRSALRHELAHVRRRDNLKKLVLRFVGFPGMAKLEQAWVDVTEMAADDAAVSTSAEALDLAAAIIKLSRLGTTSTPGDLTMALVQGSAAMVNNRVERLIDWNVERRVPATKRSAWLGFCAFGMIAIACGLTYSALLVHVHTATEWLVR